MGRYLWQKGRGNHTFRTVFEFKLDGSTREALEQINNKGYLIPYTTDGRELVKVGVSFNAEERNIGEWKISEG